MFTIYLLIFLFFISLCAFITLNSLSIVQYKKGLEITINNTKPKCQYNNQDLTDSQVCKKDSNKKFVANKGINYLIDTVPAQYIQICSSLCQGDINNQGECSKDNSQYQDCINYLKPSDDCAGIAQPVSYINNVYYYAKEVLKKSC